MFGDMNLLLAWFGLILLLLLFRVPFLIAAGRSHPWLRGLHRQRQVFQRLQQVWHR